MGKQIQIKMGCDPELFVSPRGTNILVSAHGLVPGTKHDPHGILDGIGMIQVDGCALEFGIEPAVNSMEWSTRINAILADLKTRLPEYDLKIQPVAEFDEAYFEAAVPDEAKLLGCEPDFNAWTKDVNPPPDISKHPNIRSAGGHIHFGWCKNKNPMDKNHFEDCCTVVRELDYFIGCYSVLCDKDNKRRTQYGKAGSFRPKPYGCEYRTPSNFWLKNQAFIDWVYYAGRCCMNNLLYGNKRAAEVNGNRAQEVIDNGERDWVEKDNFMKNFSSHNPAVFNTGRSVRGPVWRDS